MSSKPPQLIIALAESVNGVPWSWKIYPDRVAIVLTDGRKFEFDPPAKKTSPSAGKSPAPKDRRKAKNV